ncbi:DUF1501 domain-containing protein [Lignipirellula cremea]|uniref:DUF1501 domain-containing protein n=1 Tax=Lignipirellula cremea TaxID=2528010 RepID=A0A518DVV5_9BACT|nr:DUF1501 domain-containing protein [Lignipirellula cremea]QDU95953.1 hypothetical protein Pla8534_37720 [Lignipirellula cremea]
MNDIQMNRRQALLVGGLGAMSLGMPGSVIGSDKVDANGQAVASDKSCIFVLLCGGPSHVDTWDMKPNAPASIRGPYQPIATKVPGMRINEMHTRLAGLTDQFTLINSMTHPGGISNHFDAMHNLLSGQSAKRVQQGVPDDQPYLGSFVAKHRPSERNLVSNAWLIKCVGPPVFCAPNIGIGGYLGSAYAPVFVGGADNHPAMATFTPPEIYNPVDEVSFNRRKNLLSRIESQQLAGDAVGKDWNDLRAKAYEAMTRPEGRQAFELDREPAKVRESYGMHPLGQNLLLARRMVESGVRFVTVNGWTGQATHDKAGPPSSSWDMHGGNMGMGNAFGEGSYGMGFCLPRLDQALAGLLTDLKDRGMMENTLVVVMGEFGRTPKILTQEPPGRQHWPKCFSAIMAGCGIRGGAVYGKSDKDGAYVESHPVRPEEMAATIYHALDIPLNEPQNNSGISRPITTGKPLLELFG